MPAEAIAPPAPETMADSQVDMPSAESTRQEILNVASLDAEAGDGAKALVGQNLSDLFTNSEPEASGSEVTIFRIPETTTKLIADQLPPGVWQNGAIMHVINQIKNLKPEIEGMVMGSGTTWWFMSFREAMTVEPDYVAGFAQSYFLEKLWQDQL